MVEWVRTSMIGAECVRMCMYVCVCVCVCYKGWSIIPVTSHRCHRCNELPAIMLYCVELCCLHKREQDMHECVNIILNCSLPRVPNTSQTGTEAISLRPSTTIAVSS